MNFCEQCGQRLTPDARFCEQCGAAAVIGSETSSKDGKASSGYSQACIVVINTAHWIKLWGEAEARELLAEIQRYVRVRSAQSGLQYSIQDIGHLGASPSLEGIGNQPGVIGVLREAVALSEGLGREVRYFLLIGGGDDVPTATYPFYLFQQGAGGPDPDSTIATDFCYESLCGTPFWNRSGSPSGTDVLDDLPEAKYRVGRLPLGKDTMPSDVRGYLRRAARCLEATAQSVVCSVGISAEIWDEVSKEVLSNAGSSKKILGKSPPVTPDEFSRLCDQHRPDILFFNVHGSEEHDVSQYIGHDVNDSQVDPTGKLYCPVDPKSVASVPSDHLTVSEACYGARFQHPTTREPYKRDESIMLSSIYSKCLGFLGASRAAYGHPVEPELADLVALEFLNTAAKNGHWSSMGCSLGEAAAHARFSIPAGDNAAKEVLRRKNILIFNLYGDPTLFHNAAHAFHPQSKGRLPLQSSAHAGSKGAGFEPSKGNPLSDLAASVSGLHENLRGEMSRTIERVSRQLRSETLQHINRVIYTQHPWLAGIPPLQACFCDSDSGASHLLSYRKNAAEGLCEVLVVTNDDGNIVHTYTRK